MKKHEIVVGGKYIAKVANKLTTVRVDGIREVAKYGGIDYLSGRRKEKDGIVYDVTNLATERKTIFRSAGKFRSAVIDKTARSVPRSEMPVYEKLLVVGAKVVWRGADGKDYRGKVAKQCVGGDMLIKFANRTSLAYIEQIVRIETATEILNIEGFDAVNQG